MEEVADLLTREQGKPITESYTMELIPTIDALRWCADAGQKILADEQIRYPQAVPARPSAASSATSRSASSV